MRELGSQQHGIAEAVNCSFALHPFNRPKGVERGTDIEKRVNGVVGIGQKQLEAFA